MILDCFWKFLLLILTVSFIIIKKIKSYFKLALNMLYNRQSRAKLFRSFFINEEEILERIHTLTKKPCQFIICLAGNHKNTKNNLMKIKKIISWTKTLGIKQNKIYTLKDQEDLFDDLKSETTRYQCFRSFYSNLIADINNKKYTRSKNSCPMILVFNSLPYMSGAPFTDSKGGEIFFCGDFQTFNMVDFEQCFKKYAGIEQRLGK